MQSSIEMIIEEVKRLSNLYENKIPSVLLFETLFKAEEMHKQEIINAWEDGYGGDEHSANEYYQETFVSKGSSEIELPKQDIDKLGNEDVPKLGYDVDLPTTTSDLIDSAIWSLPFDERMKCWDLIEKLIEEEKETLYTEEQVREALSTSRFLFIKEEAELIIQSLKQHKKD